MPKVQRLLILLNKEIEQKCQQNKYSYNNKRECSRSLDGRGSRDKKQSQG